MFYTLSRRSYQRASGAFAYNGKCRPERAVDPYRAKRIGTGCDGAACHHARASFEIKFIEITQPEQTFELNGYRLKAFRVNHNVVCYGYTIEIDRAGKFDLERALSQEIPKQYWKHLQKGETIESDGKTYTPEMVLGAPRKGLKLTYCTDTRPTNSIRENAKGSDLFICEGMYGEKEKAAKSYRI